MTDFNQEGEVRAFENTINNAVEALGKHYDGNLQQSILKIVPLADEMIAFTALMSVAQKALAAGEPLDLEPLLGGHLASSLFAVMLAGEFKRTPAKNYLELTYVIPEFGEFTVTTQLAGRRTPGKRVAQLEAVLREHGIEVPE